MTITKFVPIKSNKSEFEGFPILLFLKSTFNLELYDVISTHKMQIRFVTSHDPGNIALWWRAAVKDAEL